ncbi:11847_t:CDS:2, partial [Ambispora leptoticha]
MEGKNRLVMLVESMIGLVVEVVKTLKKRRIKKKQYRPRLCYECRRPGHLAETCPNRKSQGSKSCNVKDNGYSGMLVDVRHMELVGKVANDVEMNNQDSWRYKRSRYNNESTYLVKKRLNNPDNGTKVGPVHERNLEMRNGMLVITHTKNHVGLPNSRRWTKVCCNRSNSGNMRPRTSNVWRVSSNVKGIVSKERQSMLGSIGKVEFFKRLYLEQLAGCDHEHLESAVFGSRLEMRKIG